MPPRKSTARQSSATPIKKTTRGPGALPDNASATRRSLRSTSQAGDQLNGVHGNLPAVQTQQSYAYGSTKAPLLPDQLRPREEMSLGQIANTIDQQRSEADHRFRKHAVEVETNLTGQSEGQTTRAARRNGSIVPTPRIESFDSQDSDLRKTQRTAEWASSLESEHYQDLSEEESELIDDDNTRHGTDPSSFPSGIDDQSYNYERGLRRPRLFENGANTMSTFFSDLGGVLSQMARDTATVSRKISARLLQASRTAWKAKGWVLRYFVIAMMAILTIFYAVTYVSYLFCAAYRHSLCDPSSTTAIQTTLQNYCGECNISYNMPSEYLPPEQQPDASNISRLLPYFRRHLDDFKKGLVSTLDAKFSLFSESVEEIKERQLESDRRISDLARQKGLSSGDPTVENRINYFAPGSGAVINPMKSSPTLQRPLNLAWKSWQVLTGRVKYASNPPAVALEPWKDLGDCWCAAGGEDIRLDVKIAEFVYPTDITIEHIATSATPDPGTAPREVEIWANFAHLSAEEFAEKDIWSLVGTNPIAPGMGKIATVVFDARVGADPAQSFRLDVNQDAMIYSAQEVTVRVLSNQGADRTCLYRVRLYGKPVVPHPLPLCMIAG